MANLPRKLVNRISDSTEALTGLLLLVVVALNLAQIFFRYVVVDPISWSEEAMRYATTWMVMLAAAPALLRHEHMAVDFLQYDTPPKLRRVVRLVSQGCVAAFCILLIWKGFPGAIDNMRQVSPAIRVPMTLPYLAVPVGAVLILINTVAMMLLPEMSTEDLAATSPSEKAQ
ncbi:TRAP transporter small permease [Aliiruegeria lutimaris]|uniref:TRAP transporter small permease protein n=1 Tax=Aliiruegeria lutimaris TaxID=571298 RepID=A0A1G9DA71_9RHOB|nr:TRAP transporter small permease [Aliiruegeria lutimaris]SDK60737.1 TRAP-type C4-dicarboxylate transport system, small permease component [Aliiruegeria lutimaris]